MEPPDPISRVEEICSAEDVGLGERGVAVEMGCSGPVDTGGRAWGSSTIVLWKMTSK